MNFKRPLEGSGPSDRVPKRRLASSASLLRNPTFSQEDLDNIAEPIFRRMVREEIDRIFPIFLGSSSRFLNNPIQRNGEAHPTLQFITDLPKTVFTENKIQADGNSRVLIELTDSRTGSRITTGPLSSLKIEIVALNGDFDPDNSNFNEKIVVEREGRRPILKGDLTIRLTKGLGCLENVVVTDNSSWIPCRKFRLGARVSPKSRVEERVREASSGAFNVKDVRGQRYEKHHPPYLNDNDEVWRLKRIAKGGKYCKRLASIGVQTVKDFLRFQETNPSLLKKILGDKGNGISDTTWESIVGHAGKCKIDDNEMFTYSLPELANVELLFDQVYRVKGATFDGRKYCPVEKLNDHQKNLVENLKQQAFNNLSQLTPVKGPLAADRFLVQQDISEALQDFGVTYASTFCYKAPETHISEVSGPQFHHPGDFLPSTVTGNFTTIENNFDPNTTSCDQNGPQLFHVSANFPLNSSWTPGNSNGVFLDETECGNFTSFASNYTICMGSNEAGPSFNIHIYSTARSRVAWCKIRAAFKWRSVRRNLATQRNHTATRQQVFCQ